MPTTIVSDENAVDKIMPKCRMLADHRARWLSREKENVAIKIVLTALAKLPTDMPLFSSMTDKQAFREEIQFETIQALRSCELEVGITLDSVSHTRWQWVCERAIGEIVAVVVSEYLK